MLPLLLIHNFLYDAFADTSLFSCLNRRNQPASGTDEGRRNEPAFGTDEDRSNEQASRKIFHIGVGPKIEENGTPVEPIIAKNLEKQRAEIDGINK